MQVKKLDVRIATFSYGGNGGIASEHPDVGRWLTKTVIAMKADPRIGRVGRVDYCDTPITMTRNRAVKEAIQEGFDLVLMVDSDQQPDCEIHDDPNAKPFWASSFDRVYAGHGTQPVAVFAPYCGPPPNENVYVFTWRNCESDNPHEAGFRLAQYEREEATTFTGIMEAAAAPTGLILWDLELFRETAPKEKGDRPWFYYEYTDLEETQKGSTEDVTATRDISLHFLNQRGYNPILCNWSAWAGHWKPKCVRKPRCIGANEVQQKFANAVLRGHRSDERMGMIDTVSDETLAMLQSRQNGHANGVHNGYTQQPITNGEVKLWSTNSDKPLDMLYDPDSGVISVGFRTPKEDIDVLKAMVRDVRNRLAKGERDLDVAEIGSWVGESAIAILEASGGKVNLHCVDTWDGTGSDRTREICESIGGRNALMQTFGRNITLAGLRLGVEPSATTHQMPSALAVNGFRDQSLDLVFIDADHSYDGCLADIKAWLPKVRPGGIICGHDFGTPGFPGVKRAVEEVFGADYDHRHAVWFYRVVDLRNIPWKTRLVDSDLDEADTDVEEAVIPGSHPDHPHRTHGSAPVDCISKHEIPPMSSDLGDIVCDSMRPRSIQ